MTPTSRDVLEQYIVDLQMSDFLLVASLTAVTWDILTTLSEELSLVWSTKRLLGKVIYSAIRYPILLEGVIWLFYTYDRDMEFRFCRLTGVLDMYTTLIFIMPVQVLMVFKTIALWNQSRRIKILLFIALGVSVAVIAESLITLSISIICELLVSIYIDQRNLGCGLETLSVYKIIPAFATLMVFDTLVIVLTLIRHTKSFRNDQNMLLNVLIRDGLAYYVTMFVVGIANLSAFIVLPAEKRGQGFILLPVMRATMSILGGRIVLNVRRASAFTTDQYTTPSRITDMSFWTPPDSAI